jgi:hypothetical protein
MGAALQPAAPSNFDRLLVRVGDRTLISSTCLKCGFTMIGSVTEGLPQQEANHLKQYHPTTRRDPRQDASHKRSASRES